jgi:hypothetical protein
VIFLAFSAIMWAKKRFLFNSFSFDNFVSSLNFAVLLRFHLQNESLIIQ